jgi:hypothetical protein
MKKKKKEKEKKKKKKKKKKKNKGHSQKLIVANCRYYPFLQNPKNQVQVSAAPFAEFYINTAEPVPHHMQLLKTHFNIILTMVSDFQIFRPKCY